ncbi:suppressor of tumorigenicity 14 protein homolog [Leucoraja erinacea]|uniref:suppressor of tumorigenicity 14 protein homolog n=1 Tax=Leucoraja erinaceus TaxID=7782 RepID=UPI0024546C1D|nr:suppressor of tumorigenicity 14 protein homolog [Leucoraja erinacea]
MAGPGELPLIQIHSRPEPADGGEQSPRLLHSQPGQATHHLLEYGTQSAGVTQQPQGKIRQLRSLIQQYICNKDIYNKIVFWRCKVWMCLLAVVVLIITLVSAVIIGIRATPLDDEFIDPNLKIHGAPRYYVGSMRLPNNSFTPELATPQSRNFSSLANTLKTMLQQLYRQSPALGYYFVDSDVFSFSNGSVIAHYWLQFALPKEAELLIRYTLSIEVLINVLRQHLHTADVREVAEVDPSSVTLQVANEEYVRSLKTGQCVFHVLLQGRKQTFDSLGLVNCSRNSSNYWLVQGMSGYSIKADITWMAARSVCSDVEVATYSSWFPDTEQTVSKFIQTGHAFTSELVVSGSVLLVTFNPRAGCELSQYSITFLQVPETDCGGVLVGTNGSFVFPSYSNDLLEGINCTWNLKLQEHFRAKLTFKDFRLDGSPNIGASCVADYLEVDGQRFCGEHQQFCLYSKGSSLQIKYHSNLTHTKSFTVDYMATTDELTGSQCH